MKTLVTLLSKATGADPATILKTALQMREAALADGTLQQIQTDFGTVEFLNHERAFGRLALCRPRTLAHENRRKKTHE